MFESCAVFAVGQKIKRALQRRRPLPLWRHRYRRLRRLHLRHRRCLPQRWLLGHRLHVHRRC